MFHIDVCCILYLSADPDLCTPTCILKKKEDEEELLEEGVEGTENDPNSVESVKRSILAYMETRRAVRLLVVRVGVDVVCVSIVYAKVGLGSTH